MCAMTAVLVASEQTGESLVGTALELISINSSFVLFFSLVLQTSPLPRHSIPVLPVASGLSE